MYNKKYSSAQFKLPICLFVHTCKHIYRKCTFLLADLLYTLVQLNAHGVLYMHHTNKFITSTHFVNQQTHMMHSTNKLIKECMFNHQLHITHQTCTTWISSSQAQLQHNNYYNIKKRTLYYFLSQQLFTSAQFWNDTESTAGTSM